MPRNPSSIDQVGGVIRSDEEIRQLRLRDASRQPVAGLTPLLPYLASGWVDLRDDGVERIDGTPTNQTFTNVVGEVEFDCSLGGNVTAVEVSMWVAEGSDLLELTLMSPDGHERSLVNGWDAGTFLTPLDLGRSPGLVDADRLVVADDGPISVAHTGEAQVGRMHPDEGFSDWNTTDKSLNAQFSGRVASGTWKLRGHRTSGGDTHTIHHASLTVTTDVAEAGDTAAIYRDRKRGFLEGFVRWAGASPTSTLTDVPLPEGFWPRQEVILTVSADTKGDSPVYLRGFDAKLSVGVDGLLTFPDGMWAAAARPTNGGTTFTEIPLGAILILDGLDYRVA